MPPLACLSGCGRARKIRGRCLRCYKRAQLLVRRGLTTWAVLEAAGQAAPAVGSPWHRFAGSGSNRRASPCDRRR